MSAASTNHRVPCGKPAGRRLVERARRVTSLMLLVALTAVTASLTLIPATEASAACGTTEFGRSGNVRSIAPGGTDCTTFSANAGQRVRILVSTDPGVGLLQELVGPTGVAACAETESTQWECRITKPGTQTLTLRPKIPSAGVVRYSVSALNLTSPTRCKSVALGDRWTGSEFNPCARFQAKAGTIVKLTTVGTDGPTFTQEIITPDGTTQCAPVSPPPGSVTTVSTCTLTRTGLYSILYDGGIYGGTKDPAFFESELEWLNNPTQCTPRPATGRPRPVDLSGAGRTTCFTFSGEAGQTFRLRQGTADAYDYTYPRDPLAIEILGPDGSVECPKSTEANLTCTVSQSGTHKAVITPSGSRNFDNDALAIRRLAPRLGCPAFRVGTVSTDGTLAAAELDCFAVDAAAGEILRLRLAATGGKGSPTAEVIDADGATICPSLGLSNGGAIRTCTATRTGTFTVIVAGASAAATPSYAVSIQRPERRPTGCTEIRFGHAPQTAATTRPAEVSCFRLWGQAGDVVRLRAAAIDGSWSPVTELIDPAGIVCSTITGTGYAKCVLTKTGRHTVLVGATATSSGTGIGRSAVSIQRLSAPARCTKLTPGAAAIPGALSAPAEMDCYTIQAAAEQLISVHVTQALDAAKAPSYEVIGPDGRVACGPTSASNLVCDADIAGTYTVLLGGRDDVPGDYAIRARVF